MDVKTQCRIILRAVLITVNNLYAIPMYLIWMALLLPLKLLCPSVYWFIEGYLFEWLLGMVANFLWTAGYTVREVGDDVRSFLNDKCLVVCNHQSTADVPTLMCSFFDKTKACNRLMWIMDNMFKYSHFGAVSQVHQDFFIKQGKECREQQLISLKSHLEEVFLKTDRKWLVIFPEGGFLRKRREASNRYAVKHGYPVLDHLTLPRTAGMEVILKSLSIHLPLQNGFLKQNGINHSPVLRQKHGIKYLIDITIGYPEGKPLDAFCIIGGHRPACQTTLLYRVYPISEVPVKGEELLMWMYKRWEEKEELLKEFYATNEFPQHLAKGSLKNIQQMNREIIINRWKMVAIHVFYVASAYIQYVLAKNFIAIFV